MDPRTQDTEKFEKMLMLKIYKVFKLKMKIQS